MRNKYWRRLDIPCVFLARWHFEEGMDVFFSEQRRQAPLVLHLALPVNPQKKRRKKPLDFRNLEQLPRGWKAMWMNDSSMGRSSTGQTVKGGALAETSLLCSCFWCGCSWVPSYSRGCFVTDHLAAAPGSAAYLLQPEGDGISCWFHQDLPAWHIQTAAG